MKTKIPRPVILATLLLLAGTKTSVAGVEIEYRYYTPDSRGTLKEVTALNFANQVSIPNDFYQTITSGFRSGDAADALGAIEESNGETEIKIHVTIQSLANRTTVVRYDWEADGGICKNPQFGSMSFSGVRGMADWSYYEAFRNRPGSQASLLRGIGAKLKACSAKNSGTKAEFNAPPVVFKRGRPPARAPLPDAAPPAVTPAKKSVAAVQTAHRAPSPASTQTVTEDHDVGPTIALMVIGGAVGFFVGSLAGPKGQMAGVAIGAIAGGFAGNYIEEQRTPNLEIAVAADPAR